MSEIIRIKKGKNIFLKGIADKIFGEASISKVYGLNPPDFNSLIPKLDVKEGDEVKAGTVLFHDKKNENIVFTSPVSGEVVEILRGAKRKILEVKVLADGALQYEDFGKSNPEESSREQIIEKLQKSGCWPFIRQRPFSITANQNDTPRDIYISCFDTSPLAPDLDFIVHGQESSFQTGINALKKLTSGSVHLNVFGQPGFANSFIHTKGVKINQFTGPHPAGNVGVQIHHLAPINKGEIIWYIGPQEVIIIGKLFEQGKFDPTKIVAVTGSRAKAPKYIKTRIGAAMRCFTENNLSKGKNRIISGNVLTGTKVTEEGFLGFFDNQITVIPEGDRHKFFLTEGWLSLGFGRFSTNRSYPSWLFPKKNYDLDTNLNGEIRSFVVTGEMEKVFPFSIYPMHLVKSIMANDIDLMEKLGIYEVDSEDFALCEVVCTSKINIQEVVKNGMNMMKEELG